MVSKIFLGHGASGSAASMKPWVTALQERGVTAVALDLPWRSREQAVDIFRTAVLGDPECAVGGHSYGGRMASLLSAEADQEVSALVLLSYPLHKQGQPDQLRTGHWERIRCPVLLLSGERDPFAKIDLLRQEVPKLKNAELITYPGVGHGLLSVSADATEHIARFLAAV